MTRSARIVAVAAAAASLLTLAACGAGEEASGDATGSTASATTGRGSLNGSAEGTAGPDTQVIPDDAERVPGADVAGRAATAATASGSARVETDNSVEGQTSRGEGAIDVSDGFKLDFTNTASPAEDPSLTTSVRMLSLSDTQVWVQVPETEGMWVDMGPQAQAFLGSFGLRYLNPSTWTELVGDAEMAILGEEDVAGVRATHYALAPGVAAPDGRTEFDIWLGPDDLPVRVDLGAGGDVAIPVSATFSDWGTPVDITAPDESQTSVLPG